jgi:rRNA maturation RNase YbeY
MENTRSRRRFLPKGELDSVMNKALRILNIGNSKAEIFLLRDKEMKDLKRKSTGKMSRKIPDILSFATPPGFPNPEEKKKVLGEIYINQNAVSRDPQRAAFLVVHGLLHLLGYSHSRKDDILKMEKAEKKIIKKLGLEIRN